MPLFEYRAIGPDGKPVEGSMDETSAQRVTQILRDRGLEVNSVRQVGRRPGLFRLKRRLTWEDINLLNEQLMAITKSGLPLAPSLKALAQDIGNRRLRPVLEDIHARLEAGGSLDDAFSSHPESFPPVYRSMLRAGERTGNLSGVLSHLCTYSERMVEVKNSVQEALAYPILVLVAACVILGFLMIKVIPAFAAVFQDFGAELPGLTQSVIDISSFFTGRGFDSFLWVLGALIVLVFGYKTFRRTETGEYAIDWLKSHVPVMGRLFSAASKAQFSRSLGLLLASNVPLMESLELAAAAAGNAVLREAVRDAARLIEGGDNISYAFESTGHFGHSFCWILGTAEERGEVDRALLDLADSFESSMGRTQRTIMTFVGPLAVIVLGFLIGSIVVALYLPIFTLGDAINQP